MKAILIVDIGNDEYLLNKEIDTICFKDGDKIYDNFNFLKPMPSKKVSDGSETDEIYGCYVGWNSCIDEILGDTEDE